jgi:subfamily B ATP-binding cassette protein HlyB/CyaB
MTEFSAPHHVSSAVLSLCAVAHHAGLALSPDRLTHQYALAVGEEPAAPALVRMARENGFKAQTRTPAASELEGLSGLFPVLARMHNGAWVVLAGAAQGEVSVLDPSEPAATLKTLPLTAWAESYAGEIVVAKRRYGWADESQPFGLRWFLSEILLQRSAFRDVAVASVFLTGIGLASPIFTQLIIDKVLPHESSATLVVLVVGMLLCIGFETAFTYLRQLLLLGATNKVDMRLTRRAFAHLLSLPIQFFESSSAGVVMRHMQQLEKIRGFLTGSLFFTALECLSLLIFGPMLFFYSPMLAGVVLLFTLAMALVVVALIKPFQARLNRLYAAEAKRQAVMVESIHGMRTVKALALEPAKSREWDERSAHSILTGFSVMKMSFGAQAVTQTLERGMSVAIIGLGALAVFEQQLSVGALIAFQMISGRVVGPLVRIVGLVHEYQEVALSVRMLGEIMNHPPEGRKGGGLRPHLQGGITFENVGFRYPSAANPTLQGVNLDIKPGQVIGLVGRSGSGKTTLTRLIQGLYGVSEGVVRLDGVDIREVDLAHLRKSIGVVLQDNFMFRGTIRENISAAKPNATIAEVMAAAQAAGADEFIERLPQGYETLLEENAANLSGGQKQRLSIARALLPSPRLLILDEAASALDPESEAIFIANLERIAVGKTVLMVSHRLSTLVKADSILVFETGRVAHVGRHEELLKNSPTYLRLWLQQMGKV